MQIKPLEKEHTSEQARRVFDALEQKHTPVTDFHRMLAHKPAILAAYAQLSQALWAEDSALPPKLKDMAYLRVSIINGCEF